MDSEKINRLIAENNLEKALAYIYEWLLDPLERRQGILLERTGLLETRKLETHNRKLSESHRNQSRKPGQTSL